MPVDQDRTMPVALPRRAPLAGLLCALLALGLVVGLPTTAEAVAITVTRTDDPAPGTAGQCGSPASGASNDCSLRQAIRRANDLAGADEVILPAGTYTLSQVGSGEDDGATGDVDILGDLSITGAGSTATIISGAGMHGADPDRILHVDGVDLAVSGVTLADGQADELGGALRNDGGGVTLTDVVLRDNLTTTEGGGALATLNGTVTISQGRFEDNRTDGMYGGAIFHLASDDGGPVTSTVSIADSMLSGNESAGQGGAVHSEAEGTSTADLVIDRSTFTANTSDCCGGAITADDASWGTGGADARTNVVVRDSTLTGNDASDCCGGAIYVDGTPQPEPTVTLRIERSSVDGNTSEGPGASLGCCGGALYVSDADVQAVDSTFNGNVVPDDGGCCGGGIYVTESTGQFTRVELNDNITSGAGACCGGAGAIRDSVVTFTDSEILRNTVGDGCCAGAFDISSEAEVTFLRTTIADNEAVGCCGGAIEAYGGATLRVIDSTVSDNHEVTGSIDANQDNGGGAIAIYHDDTVLEVVNSTISGNTTAENGGAIMANRGAVTIVHSTIMGNTAAGDGSALAVGNPTDPSDVPSLGIVNSVVEGTCLVSDWATLTSGGGNVTTDAGCGSSEASDQTVTDVLLGPLADNGGGTMTHAPLPGSPVLDAAVASTPDPVTADQRGVDRPLEGDGIGTASPDSGAVEAAFTDVSLVKTVSSGSAYPDEVVTWTVAASNDGLTDTTAIVTDTLPAGLTFVDSDDCDNDAGTVTCDLGVLPVASTVEATFTTSAPEPGSYTNTATVELPATATDADDADDTASALLTVVSRQNPLPGGVDRLFGDTRIETAVAVSNQTYADGAAGAVVLARADLYPDALAGTPLAVQEDAPLLLTSSTSLTDATADEIQRVLPAGGTVFLLGGPGAVSSLVEDAVEALGYTTVRFAGDNRFETAVAISTEGLGEFGQVFLVTGANFPDAVAAGAAAGATDGVIVLTRNEEIPEVTQSFLDAVGDHIPVWAVGGPAGRAQDGDNDLIGVDRIETALLVAQQFFDDPPVAGVATGYEFPDALTGGAQLGAYGGPMLLSHPQALSDAVAAYLAGLPDDATVWLYGGEAALNNDVAAAVEAARS